MERYEGLDNDKIERGGEYNQHSKGEEICNFSNNNGIVYGYVRANRETILIERLGLDANKRDDSVSGVTVVWTAVPEEGGGTVVVGWYEDATVYRKVQTLENPNEIQEKNGVLLYHVMAPSDKAVLLPVEQRELQIPRGEKSGIGQSNIWFADKEENKRTVEDVRSLIKKKVSFPLSEM